MSTDYDAVCDVCRVRVHAGQQQAGGSIASLGYGRNDEAGRARVVAFLFEHAWHGEGARIVVSDTVEERPCDAYQRPAWDD